MSRSRTSPLPRRGPGGWLFSGESAALLSGLSVPLAFAPFNAWWILFPALAMLFLVWRDAPPGRTLLRGWLFGLGQYGFGIFWIHESFQFSAVGLPAAVSLTALLVALFALYPAILGYLVTRGRSRPAWLDLLMLYPLAWTLVEWARGWLFSGFPWLQAGYAQIDGPLAGFAPLSGVLGVTWLVVLMAGGLALAWPSPKRLVVALLGLLLLSAGGMGLAQIQWTEPAGSPVEVAVIQGNVPQDLKWRPEQRQPTLDRYLSLTARHDDVDLVVWPETAVPVFYESAETFLAEVSAWGNSVGFTLLTGIPYREPESGRYFNSVVAVGLDQGSYHKRHLVPFGEYIPFLAYLGPLLDVMQLPMANFSAGPERQAPIVVGGYRIGVSVCYEGIFGGEMRREAEDAALLVNVSNDAWFGDSIGPRQHLQMVRMRALETGRELVRATNTGLSALVGADGGIIAMLPPFQAMSMAGRVTPRAGATPYLKWGDWPLLSALALVGVTLVRPVARRTT